MLDRYVFVKTERQAPETPIPVWDELHEEYRLGGAANVANNLKSIGGDEVEVQLAGVFKQSDVNRALIKKCGVDTVLCCHGQGMVKNRFIEEERIIFRSDTLKRFDVEQVTYLEKQFEMLMAPSYDAVIISDYDKGTVTPGLMTLIQGLGVSPIVVDSKRKDLNIFKGSQVLKVNSEEYGIQSSMERLCYGSRCVESLFDYVVITKGSQGAELRQCEKTKSDERRSLVYSESFGIEPVQAKDVTGCGDTHTAALTFALLKNGGDIRSAIKFANACARSVVQKFGTSVPTSSP